MLLKASAGIHPSPDPYQLWSGGAPNSLDHTLLNRLPSTKGYSSELINFTNRWQLFDEARVEVIDNGTVAAHAVFDTVGSTRTDWFRQSRYLPARSSFTDLASRDFTAAPGRHFRIEGERAFYINYTQNSCNDEGWLMATHGNACGYETSSQLRLLYSPTGALMPVASMPNGDALVVFAR
jgi:hypothetical protein